MISDVDFNAPDELVQFGLHSIIHTCKFYEQQICWFVYMKYKLQLCWSYLFKNYFHQDISTLCPNGSHSGGVDACHAIMIQNYANFKWRCLHIKSLSITFKFWTKRTMMKICFRIGFCGTKFHKQTIHKQMENDSSSKSLALAFNCWYFFNALEIRAVERDSDKKYVWNMWKRKPLNSRVRSNRKIEFVNYLCVSGLSHLLSSRWNIWLIWIH